MARTPCLQQRLRLLAVQPLLDSADLAFPLVCVPQPTVTAEAQQGPHLLVGLQVINWRRAAAGVNLAAVVQDSVLALQILEKSVSQPSRAPSEQVDGLAGNLADVVGLDVLDTLCCGSRRTLLCKTLSCALSTASVSGVQSTTTTVTSLSQMAQLWWNGEDGMWAYLLEVKSPPIVAQGRVVE